MKVPKGTALYLICTASGCYFAQYAAYYSDKQYIIMKDVRIDEYTMEYGFNIYRLDMVLDEIESCIMEANTRFHSVLLSIKNLSGEFKEFVILPGGGIQPTFMSSEVFATIAMPFNCKRIEFGRPNIRNNYVWFQPCDPKGTLWRENKVVGFSKSCDMVYNMILMHPRITTEDLIIEMAVPANRVTPRLTELVKAGRIEVDEIIRNPRTGRRMSRWIAKS